MRYYHIIVRECDIFISLKRRTNLYSQQAYSIRFDYICVKILNNVHVCRYKNTEWYFYHEPTIIVHDFIQIWFWCFLFFMKIICEIFKHHFPNNIPDLHVEWMYKYLLFKLPSKVSSSLSYWSRIIRIK